MHLFSILAKKIMCESQKIQATEGNSTAGGKINDSNEWENESAGEVSLGDLIWVKLHGNSWWPAVVVDEKSVSESSKPGSKSRGKVLVRLYGSHEYLYADPTKYHSEFKTILEQNNGNCHDVLDKTLEQLRRKSFKTKGQGSKATGADASGGKTSKQDETPKKLKRKSPTTDKHAKSKADEQSTVQKKQRKNNQTPEKKKPYSRSAKEKPKSSTSKEQKRGKTSKQGEEQNKSKPNSQTSKEKILLEETSSQSSVSILSFSPKKIPSLSQQKLVLKLNCIPQEGTSPGESPKSGTRRTRVIQPPGSPFDRNGLV
ncbi:hypothetical protein HRI_002770000 [Hibiscus trionum]|uniref:PWWP domain-containing protein n=1 Tax=Hibiscus trionum TaxID=183268 RepID=A0A9W7I8X6_HIBTR|nr:hypothetical protein HRI_002770000 [Hibiscus trionum]